ncbi:hypothetical protein P7C73_g2974, partial [Tremellales sp. Uapishka_1]
MPPSLSPQWLPSSSSYLRSRGTSSRHLETSDNAPSQAEVGTSDHQQRLDKRRATNRRSQQRARENKEALIKKLQEENDLLKLKLQAEDGIEEHGNQDGFDRRMTQSGVSLSGTTAGTTSSRSPSNYSSLSPARLVTTSQPITQPFPTVHAPAASSVDLVACRQAFLAVLASVCDPHLNTIHAVCQKFAQSRGGTVRLVGDLHPPRPLNRPLNTASPRRPNLHLHTSVQEVDSNDPFGNIMKQLYGSPFDNLTHPSGYIPPSGIEGPLFVPFLEPSHPIDGYELDADGVWSFILERVDMSLTDAEELAGRLTDKIRCYGYGPVLLRRDVLDACNGLPKFLTHDSVATNLA